MTKREVRKQIIALIGNDKAELFFNEYGGLYFCMTPKDRTKCKELLGERATDLLALMIGQDTIYVPMNAYEQIKIRQHAIIDRLTALMLHHNKKQAEKLTAKEFGVSQRWVQILFNRHKRGKL